MAKSNKAEGEVAAEKKPGVIARLKYHLQNGGGTVDELTNALAADFPERKPEAMATTIRVQLVRLAKTGVMNIAKEKIEGRGADDKSAIVYTGTMVEAAE